MNPSKSKNVLMQSFLNENYITSPALCKQCETTEAEILSLENAQCIPGHTYEHRQINIFSCAGIDTALTENTSYNTALYYHRSATNWINNALHLSKKMNLKLVSEKIKNDFSQQLEKTLKGTKTPGFQSFDQAWGYWIDGTWGKCLKTISIECLTQKELSRKYIMTCMEHSSTDINSKTKHELSQAVKNYITASLDFDPYGMRHTVATDAIERFQLNININEKFLNPIK